MLQVPKNRYYTKDHLWLQKIGIYDFYVGITDFGQKELGTIDLIELTPKKKLLKEGTSWGVVYGINNILNLMTPFDCVILERNEELQKHITYINTAPYKYWFAILSSKIETASLLTYQEYKELTQ
ncbi:glycine cleavage system protein H [Ulvibacter litoralis]|uniref:Glycine cleavage system H protein n=1 Tax=Ulvibacter litoralis TaxID=227084 RepID=A0A1G7EV65_9FLAO|nr:glycine cleavage system protein H [Ulvibacter litoralis]GHC53803.1 glycine cleavage system H protein [Ulvibacter litoralis]SDE67529.1 glycine cleavage system H protein [Ulvibacter litoralis]